MQNVCLHFQMKFQLTVVFLRYVCTILQINSVTFSWRKSILKVKLW